MLVAGDTLGQNHGVSALLESGASRGEVGHEEQRVEALVENWEACGKLSCLGARRTPTDARW
jgi:hypothetical protein